MAKFFQSCNIILVLLLLTSGTFFYSVKGDVCSEDIGQCGEDCNSRCVAAHPGGQGTCPSAASCKCFFECHPPKKKECEVGIDLYMNGCVEEECNKKCAEKYPGDLEGHGYCYTLPPYVSCHCIYWCYENA